MHWPKILATINGMLGQFFETATYIKNVTTKNKKGLWVLYGKNSASSHNSLVKSLTTEATPSATQFKKKNS